MLKKYVTTQTFEVNQSKFLIKALILIHLVAIVAACFNSLAEELKVCLIILIVLSLYLYLKQITNFKRITIQYGFIHQDTTIGWEIALVDQLFVPIKILPSTVLTANFVFLHFKIKKNKKKTILIVRDAMHRETFRKLKVELKINSSNKDGL